MKQYRPAGLVLLLLAATAVVLLRLPPLHLSQDVRVHLPLPAAVAGWRGADILFCQSEPCMRSFRADRLPSRSRCPSCGGALHALSLAERRALPGDILLTRKQYVQAFGGAPVLVTVLVSGSERTSIHRPQMCLEGQGWHIAGGRVVSVKVAGREPLEVMLLDVSRTFRPARDATPTVQKASFAYWFADPRHETPYHIERMLRMAADSLLRSEQTRWAYVAVLMPEAEGLSRSLETFLAALYPLTVKARPTEPSAPAR